MKIVPNYMFIMLFITTIITACGGSGNTSTEINTASIKLVTIPENLDVLTDKILPLEVVCEDPDGDCDILITINDTIVASDTNVLIKNVDLSKDLSYYENTFPYSLSNDPEAYLGQAFSLKIKITSSAGINLLTEARKFYTENKAIWTRVKDFSGKIIDFDGKRALIIHLEKKDSTKNDSITIEEVLSNTINTIEFKKPTVPNTLSFLTVDGAIYTSSDGNKSLLQYSSNLEKHDLGYLDKEDISYEYDFLFTRVSVMVVKDDYVLWGSNDKLWLTQFSTKITTQVGSDRKNWTEFPRDNNANKAYWCKGIVDSINNLNCKYSYYYIINTSSEIDMVVLRNLDEEFRNNTDNLYKTNNGWTAFQQNHEIWTKDPDGILTQRTFFGSNNPDEPFQIERLSADGQIIFSYAGQDKFLSDTSGQIRLISSREGMIINKKQGWYKLIGRSLFRLTE